MPLFKFYFLPEETGNEPLVLNLGVQSDAVTVVSEAIKDNDEVRMNFVVALEDIPDCKVRDGDVVWRDWTTYKDWGLPARELQLMMETYRPLWEPGPGWLKLCQEKCWDVLPRGLNWSPNKDWR